MLRQNDISTLPYSLSQIAEQLSTQRYLKPSQMRQIMLDARVSAGDLLPWADFDHPVADSYGRKLVYKGDNFEIMVMSWQPGDFSTIHDHGYTQWGAVQVFGPAEHATFRVDSGRISTLKRWQMKPGEAVGVHHDLVHQMGNPSDQPFLSLHIYGEPEDIDNVTGDARIFDLETQTIQRVDGGVFFALLRNEIKTTEPGPRPDFPTRLRHLIELIRRLKKMEAAGRPHPERNLREVIAEFMSVDQQATLLQCLKINTDEHGHQQNSIYWRNLIWELKEAAKLQKVILGEQSETDRFHKYAELYDSVIGRPCLEGFMARYLQFVFDKYPIDRRNARLLSIGCGTGLVEAHMIRNLDFPSGNLYGIDISAAMVKEARSRIRADEGDILQLDPGFGMWDLAYSGLNVFHYIPPHELEHAIERTAGVVKPGGFFFGDFITPDHIRWYPNVIISEDRDIISLRTPQLIEEEGKMFQESEIVNVSFKDEHMQVTYAGKHKRFLPPMHRVRTYFEKHFGGQVDLYDAHSLELIPESADSCPSTRYIVVARKQA